MSISWVARKVGKLKGTIAKKNWWEIRGVKDCDKLEWESETGCKSYHKIVMEPKKSIQHQPTYEQARQAPWKHKQITKKKKKAHSDIFTNTSYALINAPTWIFKLTTTCGCSNLDLRFALDFPFSLVSFLQVLVKKKTYNGKWYWSSYLSLWDWESGRSNFLLSWRWE